MKHLIRSLTANPAFTIVAVVTLALGIGANTAVFSVVNAVLLRPLAYPNAGRIAHVWGVTPGDRTDNMNAPDFLEFVRANASFTTLAGYREDPTMLAIDGRDPIRVTGAEVTADFFDVFGMPASMGRIFSRDAGDGRSEPRVVLGNTAPAIFVATQAFNLSSPADNQMRVARPASLIVMRIVARST